MFASVQRNYIKILFPVTVVILLSCVIYIWSIEPMTTGHDLCAHLKDTAARKNISRQWWEWACLLQREWDEGPEHFCQDGRVLGNYYICFDEPYKPKPPCLVYSFGIDNDFTFDDAMAEVGCEVFSFDPSMNVPDHQRSDRVRFLQIGLSAQDSDNFLPLIDGYTEDANRTWKMRKLSSLKKMLGHENRTLDVLKMDIESYEWAVMKQLLKDGLLNSIRQLTLEWHIFANEPLRSEFQSMFQTYMGMKDIGFRLSHVGPGAQSHTRYYFNMQADNSFVNTLFQQTERQKLFQQTERQKFMNI